MPRTKNTRQPDGTSTVYLGKDGYWHGRVTVGKKPNGSPDRRHVSRLDETECRNKVRELENQRDSGEVPKAGAKRWRVDAWLVHWAEEIVGPNVRYKTLQGYRIAIHNHLIPAMGKHWIEDVKPEYFESLYAKMIRTGLKPATAHQVHRTARAAWREARKRNRKIPDLFDLVRAPRVDEEEVEPFEFEEIQALMSAALKRRNGVRFILALAIGTRKGETIGFRWSRLNRRTKLLRVSKQRQRQTYEHGCADPVACNATRHKMKPCPATCTRHKRCNPPCSPGCTKHAMFCPDRVGGLVDVDVKSMAGRRGIRLPDELFELLEAHRETQAKECEAAADEWHDSDFMFTQPNGKPLDPRSDHDEWKSLLAEAGVRDARLHDARHTAATVLLLLGVPERIVMELMGWSDGKNAKRYQHITAAMQNDVAARLSGFLWSTTVSE